MDRVHEFASVHNLLAHGNKYIVALSGGADSIALLLAMKSLEPVLELSVEAAHCNFHLRGAESDRDEAFCKDVCARQNVKLHLVHFATRDYAEARHVSIEMAARDLRYGYFARLREDIGAADVCVAHHRDDSVETLLLNLFRGTGVRGLRGIQPRNNNIVRPLLCVSREEILEFLKAMGQDYVTDSSNLVDDVKRNKVRLNVMPLLKTINPNVSQSIAETSIRIGEAFKIVEDAIANEKLAVVRALDSNGIACGDVGKKGLVEVPVEIDARTMMEQPSPEMLLFEILSERGFASRQIGQIFAYMSRLSQMTAGREVSGKLFASATHELLIDRGRVIVQPLRYGVCDKSMRMSEPGIYIYAENNRIRLSVENFAPGAHAGDSKWEVRLDASKIGLPLTVRPSVKGDRFVPFGMRGAKLVSDFLTNRKRTLFEKRRQLVLVDARGKIVWLIGEQIDDRVRTDGNTEEVLHVTWDRG